jgi:hypothetical protein
MIARVAVNDVRTVAIPHIRPDPACARAGPLSIQHWHWRIVGLDGPRRQHSSFVRSHTGLTKSAQTAIQSQMAFRDSATPWRWKIDSMRFSGR